MESERAAKELGAERQADVRMHKLATPQRATLENLFASLAEGQRKKLYIIVMAFPGAQTLPLVGLLLFGLGAGVAMPPATEMIMATLPPARAGVNAIPDMTTAAANASRASRPPNRLFMIAPAARFYWGHDVVLRCAL